MANITKINTGYPGVRYVIGKSIDGRRGEKIYYIRYRKDGKQIEEKVGRQYQDNMSPAKASRIRADRAENKELSNKGQREEAEAKKKEEAGKWTIDRLWNEYRSQRKPGKSLNIDANRYDRYLKDAFGSKTPDEIIPLEVNRLRMKLLKKKSPQTVVHILNLLTWTVNFGVNNVQSKPLSFKIKKPELNNEKTENLTEDELKRLMVALEADPNQDVANMMKMALFTGLRRGEIFNLQWKDLDFNNNFITIRDPKGQKDQIIPMNDAAQSVLKSQNKTESKYVFPGRGGNKRIDASKPANRIKKNAGLPEDFRPFHGLRHVFASALATSGKVSMYVLQKLLTHKDPKTTQRYAHLADKALKEASDVAGNIFSNGS